MDTNQTFLRLWDVAETQCRQDGEWIHEFDFEPGEWLIAFFEEGRFSEIFRPEGVPEEITVCDWVFDGASGIILLHVPGKPQEIVRKAVFDESGGSAWLYSFEDAHNVGATREAVVEHLAHARWKIVHR